MKSETLLSEYQMMQPLLGLLMKATNVFIIMGTRIDVSGSNAVVQVCCTVVPTALTSTYPSQILIFSGGKTCVCTIHEHRLVSSEKRQRIEERKQ